MNISDILQRKGSDLDTSEAIADLEKVMTDIRKAYGNTGADIADPDVMTPNGVMPFSYLDDDSKFVMLQNERNKLKVKAVEAVRENPALVMKQEELRLLAVNPYFNNLRADNTTSYL